MKESPSHRFYTVPTLLLLGILVCRSVCAEQLVLVGQPPSEATWLSSTEPGTLEFQVAKDVRQVPSAEFVRWSTPLANTRRSEAILVDGSRLVLADSWSGTSALHWTEESVALKTNQLGLIETSPAQLRAVLLNVPTDTARHFQLLDKLLSEDESDSDRVFLTNGDVLAGDVSKIAGRPPAGDVFVVLSLPGGTESVELPTRRIAGIRWKDERHEDGAGELAIGLRDGSYLICRALETTADRFTAQLACGNTVTGNKRDVVHLQSLGSQVAYLSDLESVEYRHNPYLDITWPYQRDRNVLGGPLVVGGHIHIKGIGMTTFARLTFRVPPRRNRFAAELAVDDRAGSRGSVVFRVYLLREDVWHEAYSSAVVRGGDKPLAVSIEIADAREIALETDFADRGDELDYADWLDARFE